MHNSWIVPCYMMYSHNENIPPCILFERVSVSYSLVLPGALNRLIDFLGTSGFPFLHRTSFSKSQSLAYMGSENSFEIPESYQGRMFRGIPMKQRLVDKCSNRVSLNARQVWVNRQHSPTQGILGMAGAALLVRPRGTVRSRRLGLLGSALLF